MKNICLPGTFLQYEFFTGDKNFQQFWDNINNTLAVHKESVNFIIPINVLTVINLQNFMNIICGMRSIYSKSKQNIFYELDITSNLTLSILLLPDTYIDKLEFTWAFMVKKLQENDSDYLGFTSKEVDNVQHIIDYMKNNKLLESDIKIYRKQLMEYIKQKENLYYLNFRAIFPELIEFIDICEQE